MHVNNLTKTVIYWYVFLTFLVTFYYIFNMMLMGLYSANLNQVLWWNKAWSIEVADQQRLMLVLFGMVIMVF